jgi:hypothetical protein
MAIQKASLFSSLLEHWCRLSGEILEPGAGLQVSVSPLAPPIQAQPKVGEWIELYERGVISREELRHQLALVTASSLSSPLGAGDGEAPDRHGFCPAPAGPGAAPRAGHGCGAAQPARLCSDAHLAALAIAHGWRLVSFDRDFERFEGLERLALA